VDALFGQQRDQLQEHLGGDHGVAQRRVAADDGDVEALGDGLQPVRFLVRVHHRRQQQRVEHRLLEAHAGATLLQLQEAHVEGGVVRHQHGVLREGVEGRQHLRDGRLAGHHLGRDAVDGDADAGIERCGSTSWSKLSLLAAACR
jgi:hypothetical protein